MDLNARPATLIEFVTKTQRNFPQATGAFTTLVEGLALATKIISREVNAAGLGSLLGLTGRRNIQGETVARLDEFANDTMVKTLTRTGVVCAIGSEELAVPIRLPSDHEPAPYAVLFDPLDGSSNIDVAVSVGTIFGVYRRVSSPEGIGGLEDLLQPPRKLVCAGYAVYGSSTILVLALANGVHGFTLDPALGEYILSHPDIKIPPKGKYYSANFGNRGKWTQEVERALADFEQPATEPARSLRYVGSLVADAHRTLLKGGIFAYPGERDKPKGKLRLLYEAGPMAMLFERAGGAATTGEAPILDVEPVGLHDRTPLVIGGADDVARYLKLVHD
ncbi:MAG: class 1 fructose-bisphosphatase [Candidatus Polarisedimenticolia bacterium]